MDKRKKGHGELVIASSDPAKNFEFIEKTLNQVAFLISVEITEPRLDHITFGWDRIRCSLLCDVSANGLCSVCFSPRMLLPEIFTSESKSMAALASKMFPPVSRKWTGFPQSIHNSMDFCSLSTVTYTNKLVIFRIYSPFFAPALCGCALMLVLSIHRFS